MCDTPFAWTRSTPSFAPNDGTQLRERLERNAFNRGVKRLADRTLDFLKVGDTIKAVYERPPQ